MSASEPTIAPTPMVPLKYANAFHAGVSQACVAATVAAKNQQ